MGRRNEFDPSALESLFPEAAKDKRLKELRKRAGLTQKQLAEITGIRLEKIQEYENGQYGMQFAGPISRYKLAAALHCSIDDFENPYFEEDDGIDLR